MQDVLVLRWSHGRWWRVWQTCAWLALVVALVIPIVVLLLRGLSDAASAAQLVSLPVAIVSLVIAVPTWFRRAASRTISETPTTNTGVELLRQGTRTERRPWHAVLIVLTLLVAGAEISTFFLYTAGAFSTEIRAEPVQTPGENPFTPPIGDDQANVKSPPNVGGTFSGSTVGLYGGTLTISSCDPDKMVAFLQAYPDKAAAWASVQGITPKDIPAYVAALTPLVLRSDTAVTNHGFANGRATTVHSVLQAGTAVLVDKFGVPRVRCYCGNPLTTAQSFTRPRYVGSAWRSFSETNITIVQQSTTVINEFTIVDPVTNVILYRPAGTRGERDRGRLEDATLAGSYTLNGKLISCSGFEKACATSGTVTYNIDCSGDRCTISNSTGGWARSHPLFHEGVTWRASGPDEGATECNGNPRPGSLTLELTVVSAASIDGVWKAQNLRGIYSESAPAVPGCAAGEDSYELSN